MRTIKHINIADHGLSGGFCVGEDKGAELLHARIRSGLNAGMRVDLNFGGVTHLTTHFLDVSVGQLYGEFSDEFVDGRLNFSEIAPDDLERVKKVIANAKHYFLYPRRWQSPRMMVDESERLAIGCRTLAGFTDCLADADHRSDDGDYQAGRLFAMKRRMFLVFKPWAGFQD